MGRNYILDESGVHTKLKRMAYEMVETNLGESRIVLAGIRENGSVIARNMKKIVEEISDIRIELINLSLDKRHPTTVTLDQPAAFDDKVIVIIDDVANSGKTMLYSLKPFLEFHPAKIQTLALVARTHKAFPIELDYIGLPIATTVQEHIYVEVDGEKITGAYLE